MIFKVSSNNTSTANGGFGKQEIRMQHHFCFQARKVESLGINHLGIGIVHHQILFLKVLLLPFLFLGPV